MADYIEYDEELEFIEDNFVACPSCASLHIVIETPSIHKSDGDMGVQKRPGTYIAYNSDSSWSASGDPEFVCSECNHRFPVDKAICWNWSG